MRRPCCALAAATLLFAAGHAAADKPSPASTERGRGPRSEQRHNAILALEQAADRSPGDTVVLDRLAHAYLDAGFTLEARQAFARVVSIAPAEADAWEGIGLAWKRDWVTTFARAWLDSAVVSLAQATRLDPSRAQAWTTLAMLRVEQGDVSGARLAAEAGRGAAPDSAGATLASGYLAYRAGRLALAESLFTVAIARMPNSLAARFRDISPLVPAEEGDDLEHMSTAEQAEHVRRFWSVTDPDPTTRVNEARLEYWARIAHASLLFSDSWEPIWDTRAELYLRYGAPASVAYEPEGIPLDQELNRFPQYQATKLNGMRRTGDAMTLSYALHAQLWAWPNLGMVVLLEDDALSQHYRLERSPDADTDPAPDPTLLARSGLLATAGGRGVFQPLPPGEHPLQVQAVVSAFQGEQGPRLLANVAAPGAPGSTLLATCVVLDSTEHEVGRAARELSASRCDPATLRAGDFAFDLPPGQYRVAVSVVDGESGRGVVRAPHALPPLPGALAISDIVLVCGPLETAPVGGSVRLDPNLERRITGDEPLLAYFEVYALRADAGGETKFEYEYQVRSLAHDARPWFERVFSRPGSGRISVHTPEEGVGPTRRQYLSVPTRSLPPGRYRLEVIVKDHGASAHREVDFEKEAS
jgi:GWxTD domain-containing protein